MKLKKILAMVLCIAMVLSTMSFSVFAEDVSGISDGDYIYFGNDESNKWLVLDADKNSMGEDGMFLVLANPTEQIQFNSEKNNSWEESNAQAWCEQYVEDHFAEWEKDAVISTTKTEEQVTWSKNGEAASPWVYGENTITDAKLFFLSLQEAAEYGLVDSIGDVTDYGGFWLRSPQIQEIKNYGTENETTTDSNPNLAAVINLFGNKAYGTYDPTQESFLYARPAFNLDLTKIKSVTKGDDGVWTVDEPVAKVGNDYCTTLEEALEVATESTEEEVTITVLKDVKSLPAPTRGGLTFKAAEGVAVTYRVNPPRSNPVDGVVKYVGFDFTTYDTGNGLFAAFDGGHELAGLEVVFENCNFGGQKSIGFSWGVNSNMEKLTIDNCTIDVVDASQYFVLGYIDNVEIKNCDFSNHTGGKSIVQCSTTSNNVTITNTNFGNGYINYAPNTGDTKKTFTVTHNYWLDNKGYEYKWEDWK